MGGQTSPASRADELHELELQYQDACHQVELVSNAEDSRRASLRILMLRNENAALKDGLEQNEATIGQLSEKVHRVHAELEQTTQRCQQQDKKLRAQARDQSNLMAEVQSLNGVSQDSTKLLSEKLALAREVALLKPEVEHLRSQVSHQKDVLAEKLALERQLNALEVELAHEKRAVQRTANRRASRNQSAKSSDFEEEMQELRDKLAETEKKLDEERAVKKGQGTTDRASEKRAHKELEDVRAKLTETEKQLAVEKKERQRLQKENERISSEAVEQHDAQEKKLARLKTKLQETQEELKQARTAVPLPREPLQLDQASTLEVTTQVVPVKEASPSRKKRRADEMCDDQPVLHTPNTSEPRLKRAVKKRLEAAVGEKSIFSITPFLNRTVSQIEGTPMSTTKTMNPPVYHFRGADESMSETQATQPVAVPELVRPLSPKRVRKATFTSPTKATKPRGRPKKVLQEATATTNNLSAGSPPKLPMPTSERSIDQAMGATGDDEDRENVPAETEPTKALIVEALPKAAAAAPARTSNVSASSGSGEPEPKKKRRKLLGGGSKTIFGGDDGDDGEGEAGGAGLMAKRAPGKIPLGGGSAVRPLARVGKAAVRMGRNAFAGASFSPLKREKRGVNASFLA